MAAELHHNAEETKPNPDPTLRTIEVVYRENQHNKEITNAKFKAFEDRFKEYDKAISLLQANSDKSPTIAVVGQMLQGDKELVEEKFRGVKQKFDDLIDKIEQASVKDSKAIDAALKAQQEAADKQDKNNAMSNSTANAGFTKQIDQIGLRFDDLKDRLTKIEGREQGSQGHSKEIKDNWGVLIGVGGLLIALGTLIAVVMSRLPPS